MPTAPFGPRQTAHTGLGLLAIVFWSTTVAVSRRLTVQLGTVTAAACIYLLAGAVSVAAMALRPGQFRQMFRLPAAYVFGCGGLFVLYTVLLYLAIGRSADARQVVEVGIINYLWPSFTILFSVPVLGRGFRHWLWPGLAMAFGGVVLASLPPGRLDGTVLLANLRHRPGPYAMAFVAAVTWGLYSNLSRRWAGHRQGGAVPLFILATAVVLVAMRTFVRESTTWSFGSVGRLAYMAVFPGLLAYVFWDQAMRRGHMILVATLSYFIPLLATLISCLYLGEPMSRNLWLACGLLIGGAAVCNVSIIGPAEPTVIRPAASPADSPAR